MFTLFVSVFEGTKQWTIGTYTQSQAYIQNFVKENYTKVSAASMAVKMFSVFILLALAPVNTHQISRQAYQTDVKLDTNSPLALVSGDRQIAIESGASNLDSNQSGALRGQVASVRYQESPSGVENYFDLYKSAASRYGIPWEILAAVHYVETGASGSTNRASYAGAQGPMQFMPGTWRAYGVDADGDGSADIGNVNDAVYGAANLLAAGGAAEGNVDAALFNYNHAQWYVDKVKDVASSIQ